MLRSAPPEPRACRQPRLPIIVTDAVALPSLHVHCPSHGPTNSSRTRGYFDSRPLVDANAPGTRIPASIRVLTDCPPIPSTFPSPSVTCVPQRVPRAACHGTRARPCIAASTKRRAVSSPPRAPEPPAPPRSHPDGRAGPGPGLRPTRGGGGGRRRATPPACRAPARRGTATR